MKKLLQLLIICCVCINTLAQQKKSLVPEMPDVNKLMKMSPAELEAYKKQMIKQTSEQAAEYADANNLNINKSAMQGLDIKQPVKDIKRLSLIPSRPPTRLEITANLQQSIQQIQKGIPAPKIEEIKNITNNIAVEEINDKAIAEFYHDNPKAGLLMLLETTVKDPDEINMMNNLAAMFNLCGVEQKAIPILMYALEKVPNSSTLLNNMGQAYLGLGEMQRAAGFFNQCLAIDELNPEANHSMGMIKYYKKEYDAAMSYFEKELRVAMRRSTLAMAYKMGNKFNLRALAANRNKHKGAAQKNFFEEITLGKFSLPIFPSTAKEVLERRGELDVFAASVQAEMLFWMQNAQQTAVVDNNNPNVYPGLYHDLVKAMLDELNEEFTPEYLNPYGENEADVAAKILQTNGEDIGKVKCPEAPAGSSVKVQQEYEIACCEQKKRPLADKLLGDLGSHITPLFELGLKRWKSYINQLVAIVQLDPSPSNQSVVYSAVSAYFAYVNTAMIFYTGGEVNNLLPYCVSKYQNIDLDSLVQSDREWRMNCPSWLNIEVDLGGAAIKADCNKYAIEAGGGLMAGFEHEFKSGKSTLLVGVGIKDKFAKILKIEAKSQFYITFDNNKAFSDFGIRNTYKLGLNVAPIPIGGIKIGANYGGVESVNNKSLLSGTDEYKVSKKGVVAALFE
jgi:tetratricopeptide (TPR) repeat protein